MESSRDDVAYQDFLDSFEPLLDQMVDNGWTRWQARHRISMVYPELPQEQVERALQDPRWHFAPDAAHELSGTVLACSIWLALNDLLQLGEDRPYTVAQVDSFVLDELRVFHDWCGLSPQQSASVLGRVGAALKYVAQYPATFISREDYCHFRNHVPESLLPLVDGSQGMWPPPSQVVVEYCSGGGSWDQTLTAIGLSPQHRWTPEGRDLTPDYTPDRFRSAMADFLTFCIRNGQKPHSWLYGQWSANPDLHPAPRPALVTLRHVFGQWFSILDQGRAMINDAEPHRSDPRYQENWVGPWVSTAGAPPTVASAWSAQDWTDRGIGVVEQIGGEASGDESAWEDLVSELEHDLNLLPWNHFLTVEYESGNTGGDSPYTQAFTGPSGVSVTLVSENFLSGFAWPINEVYLRETGWVPPTEEQPNWLQEKLDPGQAARMMVFGLRFGRDSPDPYRFRWGSGAMYKPASLDHRSGPDR